MQTIRLVQETDAPELLNIYEPYIRETTITFEYDVPSITEFTERIRKISSEYPYIVYLVDEKIVGYAYAHRHMERAAYQWNAELSVYVSQSYLRHGVGKLLYSALIELLKMQNLRNVYGCVTFPNANSEKLHESFGFQRVGVYHNTGFKCGEWQDVVWFEKTIGNCGAEPQPFIPIDELDENKISELLKAIDSDVT
jgi:phosphinothricin acetyltransferase